VTTAVSSPQEQKQEQEQEQEQEQAPFIGYLVNVFTIINEKKQKRKATLLQD